MRAEDTLLLVVARTLRRRLMQEARSGSRQAWIADVRALDEAMRPFEPSPAKLEDGAPAP